MCPPSGGPASRSTFVGGTSKPLPIVDTRRAFRPLSLEIVDMLGAMAAGDWERPTMAPRWRVRDVVAHMVDTALRRLSLQRDRPEAALPLLTDSELVVLINDLNATWVRTAGRFSPRVLTDLYAHASSALADFMESLDLHAAARLPVSWAGERQSAQWLDIGREFTEVWHHGSQVREAIGAEPFSNPRWLRAVLQIAMHAVPYAYREVTASPGVTVAIRVTGRASGAWYAEYDGRRWTVEEGELANPTTAATMPDEVAWRLLFNALSPADIRARIHVEGDADLAVPFLRARAVIV
jgi:uncharacterized protein (TIGR03083 family)